MTAFQLRGGRLQAESVPLDDIARRFGTPCYVYSRAALESAFRAFTAPLAGRDHLVCYAMKANSNLGVLDVLARLGAGFDIVSGGELARVVAAGGDPRKVVFSGVGKSEAEIREALAAGILCFNVESAAELARIERVAGQAGARAPVSLRVNPDVDPRTHPYISTGLKESKFGIAHDDALPLYRKAAASASLRVVGIGFHIGSQLTDAAPFVAALDRVLELVDALAKRGIALHHLDLGGGLGIRYRDEQPPPPAEYLGAMLARLSGRTEKILLEPGRALVGHAGVLLTRVEYLKDGPDRNFAVVDAAMNDLLRPALYDAWHDIVPVAPREAPQRQYDVVGPVCESADFLGRGRGLALAEGDLLAILSAGAYGMAMSSNYNTRPRVPEVMVDGAAAHLVRERESVPSLFALERRLPQA
ncbi:MAG TPA: diaminopimelate decarboxylase [Burkholderiales bacterium]|nr:diaminopimelate decarboxylase [Burkholderiales bacterium]